MKLKLSFTGLVVVPLAMFVSFTPCTARPQHVRGHRHADHTRRADQYSASSGSSLYINTVGVTSSTIIPVIPNSTVAVNNSLEPSVTSSNIPFFIQQATPGPLPLEDSDVSQASEFTLGSLYGGSKVYPEPTLSSVAIVVELDTPSDRNDTEDTPVIKPSTVVSRMLRDVDMKMHQRSAQNDDTGLYSHPASDAPSSASTQVRIVPRATSTATSATGNPDDGGYQSFVLSFPSKTSTTSSVAPSATAASLCPTRNGTSYTSNSFIDYTIACDMDYADNIQPFHLVSSFGGCLQKCDAYNYNHGGVICVAAIFVFDRVNDLDDCYLKSSLNNLVVPTASVQGGVRKGFAKSSSPVSSSSHTLSSGSTPSQSSLISNGLPPSSSPSGTTQPSSKSSSATSATFSVSATTATKVGVTYSTGTSVIAPVVASSHLQGPTVNQPTSQYINMQHGNGITLSQSLLVPGVNGDLTTGYDLSPLTGVLQVNISTQSMLTPLKGSPHLSRDGGRGGYVNGQHLFIFCDTGSYTTPTFSSDGIFLAFVSSSVAIDVGMNGLSGNALHLQDGIGEWSDDVGRMRGFAPLTLGEFAYNQAMQGNGQRYAVWPESSLIPLDAETSLMYAPIVYDSVNMATRDAVFTYTGSTLLTITAGGHGGPVAQRAVGKIFDQNEVEYGCGGGIRSWGPSGIGGADGKVYVFGIVSGGVLLGRTSPGSVADRNSYEYWNGNTWGSAMQTADSKAFFISGPYMDIDVFYSPRHLTFIVVYMTIYADNTFYYRYLKAPSPILPPYAPGGDPKSDYVENLTKHPWSDQQVLYKASPGKSGKYIYSGGVQSRYFGMYDIYNGGSKMLISWTAPTGENPASMDSEYQLVTAEIDWA